MSAVCSLFWLATCVGCSLALVAAPSARAQVDPGTAKPAAAESSEQLMRETIDDVFTILRNPELKNADALRIQKLRGAVDEVFDWDAMARSSLGPPWRTLDAAQRREFVAVFKELLAQQYMHDIDRFQGSERVRITGVEKRGELQIVKSTLITTSREKVPINYTLLAPNGESWKVVDLSIEGVSLVNHYRGTFGRFLANESFDELMQRLKRKLGRPSAPEAAP